MTLKTLSKKRILSPTTIKVILYLYNNPNKKMNGHKLTRELKCNLSPFYKTCETLLKNLLAEKEIPDKRSYSWKLTGKGIKLAEEIINLKEILK